MTTVVWDGKTLAWDSQITQGEIKLIGEKGRKVWTPTGEALVVCAGDPTCLGPVCAAVARGQDPAPVVPRDTSVIVLTRTSCTAYVEKTVETMTEACCWGTGSMAAYAGLHLGHNAAEACALACNVDLYSREPVHTMTKGRLRAKKPDSEGAKSKPDEGET